MLVIVLFLFSLSTTNSNFNGCKMRPRWLVAGLAPLNASIALQSAAGRGRSLLVLKELSLGGDVI